MKKILRFLSILFIGAVLLLPSCREQDFSELDVARDIIILEDSLAQAEQAYADSIQMIRDSLAQVGGIIDFSVNLVNASGSGYLEGRVDGDAALDGAVVSVSQHGTTLTDTVDASGIATFADLRIGTVSVSVISSNMTDIDANIYFEGGGLDTLLVYPDSLIFMKRSAAIMIPMFSTVDNIGTVSGILTFESDLTNSTAEPVVGATVTAHIDFSDPDFKATYFSDVEFYQDDHCSECKQIAKLINIAWNDATFSAASGADGSYSISIPATANGLPIDIAISEFAADQTLLINQYDGEDVYGLHTVRTLFGTGSSFSSPSTIPTVPRALAIIDDPTGSASTPPDVVATATAHLTESGIAAISIDESGYGYTQPPLLTISAPDDPFGVQAEANAFLTEGRVTAVEITTPGSGYVINGGVTVSPSSSVEEVATATPHITYSVTDFSLVTQGQGYVSEPTVNITSGEGIGASARAVLDGTVTDVTVDNIGSNYVLPPEINFVGVATDEAQGSVTMTTYNPIHSIEVTDQFTDTYEVAPTVEIRQTGTGSGAKAVVSLNTAEGFLSRITLDDGGSGYQQAPSVLIEGGGGQGAQAEAVIDAGGSVVQIIIRDEGRDFSSTPNVIISSPASGGTQATATAVLGYQIGQILMTDPGNGYDINFTPSGGDNYSNEPDVVLIDQFSNETTLADDEVIVRPAASIESISASVGGSGYQSTPTVLITSVGGYGSGATATATVEYTIDDLELVDGGSDYEWSSDIIVTVSCEQCTQTAEFTANIGEGIVADVELTDGGLGYTAPPNVLLSYSGASVDDYTDDVTITAIVTGGEVTGFSIQDDGGRLTAANPTAYTITISDHLGSASFSANIFENAGQISHITITDAGAGYVTTPIVEFVNNGTGGDGAAATAVVQNGRIVDIVLTNPGNGYVSVPNVNLVLPTYTKTATATVTVTDGHVTGISLTDGGVGYVDLPGVSIVPILNGFGSGATATIAEISAGVVQSGMNKIYITNQGSGYTAHNYQEGTGIAPVTRGGATSFNAISDQAYVRDIYLGSGVRTEDAIN
jgi:hypothetical protein